MPDCVHQLHRIHQLNPIQSGETTMHRITKADLQLRIDTLNEITGQPMEPWNPVRREDGGLAANVGNYHLDWVYGGVLVDQMHNVNGAVVDIIHRGTKRETYDRLGALIQGIRIGQQTGGAK